MRMIHEEQPTAFEELLGNLEEILGDVDLG